jgi:hypothetical protein
MLGLMYYFVRISLILALITGAFSRVHAMPHQQDVAHIVPVCSGGSMSVVMIDANGDPIKRLVTCPDCISVLALFDASMGAGGFTECRCAGPSILGQSGPTRVSGV